MNKFPEVEYDPVNGGVSGETAKQIYMFLADEADFNGDRMRAALYKANAESFEAVPRAAVTDKAITEAIAKWGRK